MVRRVSRAVVLIGLLAAAGGTPAAAQDNLSRGKTVQRVYATDCGICHNNSRKLGASMSSRQLSGFLAQHYTTSRTEAAAIAAYLAVIAQPERTPSPRRTRTKKSGPKSN